MKKQIGRYQILDASCKWMEENHVAELCLLDKYNDATFYRIAIGDMDSEVVSYYQSDENMFHDFCSDFDVACYKWDNWFFASCDFNEVDELSEEIEIERSLHILHNLVVQDYLYESFGHIPERLSEICGKMLLDA